MSSEEKNNNSNNNNNENNTTVNNNNNNNNNNNQNTTTYPTASDEKHNLLNAQPKPTDDNLNLPSYEEAVSFQSFVSNLEGDGNNHNMDSSFYILPQENQQNQQNQQPYPPLHAQSVPPPQQSTQAQSVLPQQQPTQAQFVTPQQQYNQAPGKQTKVNSTYLQTTSNNSNISYLQGQPSRPININAYPTSPVISPNTSSTHSSKPISSFLQGQPSRPINANNSYIQNQSSGQPGQPPVTNGSYIQGQPGQPSQPSQPPVTNGSYIQSQPGQPPVTNSSYVQSQQVTQGSVYYPNQPYYGQTPAATNIYPTAAISTSPTTPPTGIQYGSPNGIPVMAPYNVPTLPKHRFDPNQPESAINYNFETCYDGEYTDMNGSQIIGTGIIGSRKTEVKYLARVNSIRSSIGLSVVDIRGARVFNGESQIIFDGTIGKIILVVPPYCSLTVDDSYCIGEVFTHRPCEIPVNDAIQRGLPIIRVLIKNTVGDINIIEKEYNVNVTSESLNNELKKLRKTYSKNNNKNNQNNNNNGNGGTKLVSMKTMFMKSFNSAKQQLSGNPGYKPVNNAPYPQPGGQPSQYSYPMPTPYGAPVQMPPQQLPYVYGTSPQATTPYSNAPYPYQGYQPPQQNYYNPVYQTSVSNPNISATVAPAPYGATAPAPAPTSYGSFSAPNSTANVSSVSTTGASNTSYLAGTPIGGATPASTAPTISPTTNAPVSSSSITSTPSAALTTSTTTPVIPTTSSPTKPLYPYPPRD